jgi:multiple sugar transport system substrate-binding protein
MHRRSSLLTLAAMTFASILTLPFPADAQQKEVRWGQWKGTEVGEKFMAEVKAAFEMDHPGIKLVPVDSPFTGFHDRAIVQHQAKRLPDVLMVQVDWVAEFADLGLIEALDERIAREPRHPRHVPSEMARQAVLPARRKWRGRHVLQHRSVQGGGN